MSSRKRTFQQAMDEPTLTIRLTDAQAGPDDRPLVADRALLTVVSSCARGLPADSAEWDLSGLLIEGQPVSRAVVVAWLNCIYQNNYAEVFEQQEPDPANSMSGLAQLLLFADAVGTTKGPLTVCAQLDGLELQVQLGQQQLALKTDRCYWWGSTRLQLKTRTPTAKTTVAGTAGSQEEAAVVIKQVVEQTELLLYTAYKLQLPHLINKVHALIRLNTAYATSLLFGQLNLVFTGRVLDAAGGTLELQRPIWLNSIITQPCNIAPAGGARQILKPLGMTEAQKAPIRFRAELMEDVCGSSKGEQVDIKLDIFNRPPSITIGGQPHTVNLLLGPRIDDRSMEAICGRNTGAE